VRKDAVDEFLSPIEPKPAGTHQAKRKDRPLTFDDALFKLIGSARSAGPGNVSENKYEYLAEAYAATGE
jgi:hypothetical protein